MGRSLSKGERERLEADLASAEPYDEDAVELRTLDGEIDFDRLQATIAKKLLDMADGRERP